MFMALDKKLTLCTLQLVMRFTLYQWGKQSILDAGIECKIPLTVPKLEVKREVQKGKLVRMSLQLAKGSQFEHESNAL